MTLNKSIHTFIPKALLACAGVAGLVSFTAVPFLFSQDESVIASTSGLVAGAVIDDSQEPIIRFSSLVPTQVFTPLDTNLITADSFVALDTKTGDFLVSKNPDEPHSLASLSKLVTALLLVDRGLLDSKGAIGTQTITQGVSRYAIPFDINDAASRVKVTSREIFSSADLLKASLIASANDATFSLVESQELDVESFRLLAKEYFSRNGYPNTTIFEPTGLDYRNKSSAREFARLTKEALSFETIRSITDMQEATITSSSTNTAYTLKTTNTLLKSDETVLGGKTGFLDASGYTFTILARHVSGREVLIVLLGSKSSTDRITDTEELLTWLNQNFT